MKRHNITAGLVTFPSRKEKTFYQFSEMNLLTVTDLDVVEMKEFLDKVKDKVVNDESITSRYQFLSKFVNEVNKDPKVAKGFIACNNAISVSTYVVCDDTYHVAVQPTSSYIMSNILQNEDFDNPILHHFALDMKNKVYDNMCYFIPLKNYPEKRIMVSIFDINCRLDSDSITKLGTDNCIDMIIYQVLLESIQEDYNISPGYLQERNIDLIWDNFKKLLEKYNFM